MQKFHMKQTVIDPDPVPEGRWFCAQLVAGQEVGAAERLKRAGISCFVPEGFKMLAPRPGVRRHAVKRKVVLFAGYGFVQLPDDVPPALWRQVNAVDGVIRLLATGPRLRPMPDGFVEAMQAHGPVRLTVEERRLRLHKGDRVRVTNGVATGFLARVARVRGERRIAILFEHIFGGGQEVEVPISILEQIEDDQREGLHLALKVR